MPSKSSDIFGSISISESPQESKPSKEIPRKQKPQKKPPQDRRRKTSTGAGVKTLLVILVLFLMYNFAGFFLVPFLVKNQLPNYISDKVLLSINEASFNPYSFELSLQDITFETHDPQNEQDRFLSIGSILVNLDLLSLLRSDLVCSQMTINRLNLKIARREDNTYNISYLIDRSGIKTKSDIIDFAELPFLFSLNNITVSNSQVIFDDKNSGKVHHIENIRLALPALSNFPYQVSNYIRPEFSAVINGSPVTLSGETPVGTEIHGDETKETILSCNINDFDIPLYFAYLPVTMPLDISGGKANGKLQISFSPNEGEGSKLKINFSLTATDLGIDSRDRKLSLNVPETRVEGVIEPFNHMLHFQSILLREPSLKSEGDLSRETLEKLLPLSQRPAPEDPLYQVVPDISVNLLIADGGNLVIKDDKKKKPVKIWHQLQLSVKNFTNSHAKQSDEKSTFRLSGEHLTSDASFAWQGLFDANNRPNGNLQVNKVPLRLIAPFLGSKPADISGTADVDGLLGIRFSDNKEKPIDFTLKSTKVTVKEIALSANGKVWLKSPELRCEPVSRISGKNDLGNINLPGAEVMLVRDRLPSLFKHFNTSPADHVIHGINFSGVITVFNNKDKNPILTFANVSFQANQLEKQSSNADNFTFSAQFDESGEIKAKGSLQLSPFQVKSTLGFSNAKPPQVFSWFTSEPSFIQSKAVISGKGTFLYPQKEFSGTLVAENAVIGDARNPVFRSKITQFDTVSWSETAKSLDIKYILTDQPEVIWTRQSKDNNMLDPVSVFMRHIFLPEPGNSGGDPDSAISDFSLTIEKIDFANGSVSYQDNRVSPGIALGITGVNGSIDSIMYPVATAPSTVEISGNIEGTSFNVTGSGNLVQYPPTIKATFSTHNLPLVLFANQLSGLTADVNSKKAEADISVLIDIDENSPRRESEVTIRGLVPSKPGTPAATTLALLSDTTDSIRIKDLSDFNSFSKPLISEIITYVNTLFIKSSLNPILTAGDQFKNLVGNEYASFRPGTSELTGGSIERLNRYSELLSLRPLVKLRLSGYADENVDTPAILKDLVEEEEKRASEENIKRKTQWQQENEARKKLERQKLDAKAEGIVESDIPLDEPIKPYTPVLPKTVSVSQKTLENLARERQRVVADYLIKTLSIPEERVAITGSNEHIKEDGKHARVDLEISDMYDTITPSVQKP